MISVEIVINDGLGSEIRLAHGDVANLQYLLDKLVKPVGYVLSTRPWTNKELAALDKDTKVEISTEESRGGCAKRQGDQARCDCNICATKEFMDEYRSHI